MRVEDGDVGGEVGGGRELEGESRVEILVDLGAGMAATVSACFLAASRLTHKSMMRAV